MNITATVGDFFSLDGPRNLIRETWDKTTLLPGGNRVFSAIIGKMAPYTGTIGAVVEELSVGHAKVTLRDRPKVRNHLKCVHAIALVNLAEIAGNVALGYSMPDDARFIVAGLDIEYIKKARGTITANADVPVPSSSEKREYQVPVTLTNRDGDVVAKATLRTLIGPKK